MPIEPMPHSRIRPLKPSDRLDWAELWRGYQDFYGIQLLPAATEATWQRIHDDREPIFGLAAEAEGILLGIAHYIFHRTTWSEAETCYLQDLYVDPIARGQGTGRALIDAVYAHADQRSGGRVYWMTHETNATARRLYETVAKSEGFIVYERVVETAHA